MIVFENYLVRISTKAIMKADVERLAVMFDVNRSILKVAELTGRVCRSIKTPIQKIFALQKMCTTWYG